MTTLTEAPGWFPARKLGSPARQSPPGQRPPGQESSGYAASERLRHYVVISDFVAGTATFDGAINIMQRRGVGSVIQNTGHKVFDGQTGEPTTLAGPNKAGDQDFCAAIAP